MSSPFLLNVDGIWIPLTGVQREATRTVERGSSAWISSGGRRRMQFAARPTRTWALSYNLRDPSAVAWLQHAANGHADEVWLLDRMAAQANMLDPDDTIGRFNGQPIIAGPLGVPMRAFAIADGFVRKIRAGQWYHLSYTTTAAAAAVIGAYDIGAGPVNIVAPSGAGSRRGSTAFLADDDVDLEVAWSIAAKVTAARLTEGSVDQFDWAPGRNTPCRVAVSDPDGALSLFRTSSAPLESYAVTIWQVG